MKNIEPINPIRKSMWKIKQIDKPIVISKMYYLMIRCDSVVYAAYAERYKQYVAAIGNETPDSTRLN